MHPANPVVFDFDSRWKRLTAQTSRDLDSEAIVGEKNIPDARHHHAIHRGTCVIG
jgi:hypothetical protein